jgi:hypothetical protein
MTQVRSGCNAMEVLGNTFMTQVRSRCNAIKDLITGHKDQKAWGDYYYWPHFSPVESTVFTARFFLWRGSFQERKYRIIAELTFCYQSVLLLPWYALFSVIKLSEPQTHNVSINLFQQHTWVLLQQTTKIIWHRERQNHTVRTAKQDPSHWC